MEVVISHSNQGIIYILSNRAMPNLYKIGKTSKGLLTSRMSNLYTTGVPVPFECEYAVLVDNYDEVEKALHIAFSPDRINTNREFFSTTPDRVIAILKLLHGIEVTEEVTHNIENNVSQTDLDARRLVRRPRFDFHSMGIDDGATIVFLPADDENGNRSSLPIEATVCGKKVKYNGILYSLTALTQELLQSDYSVQPTPYWTYNGEKLIDIYNRCYTPNSDNEDQDNLF